jgi:hypothetical protein
MQKKTPKKEGAIMSITKYTQTVQTKLWQFTHAFKEDFSKPEHRFIHQTLFGLLKGGQVQINTIGRSLQEKISNKKVAKRLGYHLGKKNLAEKINQATIKVQKHRLFSCKYLILDDSDIVKKYAKKMQGLDQVRDGSAHEQKEGYWLCNVSAVNQDGSVLIPLYSRLYSHKKESIGENGQILKAIDQVMAYAPKDLIWVMDRGMDRRILYDALDEKDYNYLIRQTGVRYLVYQGEKMPFKQISHKIKLNWEYKTTRIKKNTRQVVHLKAGAVRVTRAGSGRPLWLVSVKYHKGGYSWYLLAKSDCTSEQEAVYTVLEGYRLRWKIEEIHRQIKQDYHLEEIRLQRYEALKSMNALLWMAVSFLYTRLEPISLEIILEPELGLVNRKRLDDLLRFIYYKLALAVKKILAFARFYSPPRRLILQNGQLAIPFKEWI